ncbi:MAG TPA: response regulator [Deltaproteobacteria bacterium]|nr:response regulator [Deltaproteobacteria bacterium]
MLAVDDEEDILNLLDYNLRRAGFEVLLASDGPEAIETARRRMPDLIVLDIMLPNMEGTEVLRTLRSEERTRAIPVVMLTAKGEEVDRIVGLELGADDYITKPFSPRELILRVKAVLKRTGEGAARQQRPLSSGGITVDRGRRKVKIGDETVRLTAMEFKLLVTLMGSPGIVFSRERLLDRVWGEDRFVTPRTVDTHIRRLRAKLKEAGSRIETLRGEGYVFSEEPQ